MRIQETIDRGGRTTGQTAVEHEYRVLQTLSHVGWCRPEEMADWTGWKGSSAVAMARRTMEKLRRDGLLLKRRIEGKGNGNAYLLSAAGTERCGALGLTVQGKGKDLQVGARWHEHVLAMHVLNDFRRERFEVAFARQLAWAQPPQGQTRSSGIRQLGEFRYARPIKAPDAAMWRRNRNGSTTAVTVEIEWAEKSGPKRRHQARSILDQVRHTDSFVCLAYPYPPALMGQLLAARNPVRVPPLSLNHELNWRRALNAAGAEPEELARILFVRLTVTERLELRCVERLRADGVALLVSQASGILFAPVGSANETWQCLEQWDAEHPGEGAKWLHLPTGFTLKVSLGFPLGAVSSCYFFEATVRHWRRGEIPDQDMDAAAELIFEERRTSEPACTEFFPLAGSIARDFESDTRVAMRWFEQKIPMVQRVTRDWINAAAEQAVGEGQAEWHLA
jgi:hypothetical protein